MTSTESIDKDCKKKSQKTNTNNNTRNNQIKNSSKKRVFNLADFSFINDFHTINNAEEYFKKIAFIDLAVFKLMIEKLRQGIIPLIEFDSKYYPFQHTQFWYIARKKFPDLTVKGYIVSQVNSLQELKEIFALNYYLTSFCSIKISQLKSIEKDLNNTTDMGFKFSQREYAKILEIHHSSLSIAAKTRAENIKNKPIEFSVFDQNTVIDSDTDSSLDW